MIIVMRPDATQLEIDDLISRLKGLGLTPHISKGIERTIIGAIGDERALEAQPMEAIPGVERVLPILKPYKLASREFKPANTVIKIAENVTLGDNKITVIAGPCSVESRTQIIETAQAVKEAGATVLRGGAFKPRTSPYTFQGLGMKGLELLQEAKAATDLPIVTEVMAPEHIPLVAQYADVLQIGARNMQNFFLLRELGKVTKPVLLKKGMVATIEECLMSAEYILSTGNYQVAICERGIRTFEKYTRNTLDVSAVPLIKQLSHLPVLVDPSHATGKCDLVLPMSKASIAAGADGLMVEVHPQPSEALSDGAQSLNIPEFQQLMREITAIAHAVNRGI